MNVSRDSKPVKTAVNSVKRGTISLKHKLQRKEGVWAKSSKSLLIDSLIRGYIVNPVYIIKENGMQYTIDGVQRLSTLVDYVNDGFSLSKDLEPVVIDSVEYEIAGKKYSKLDDVVKDTFDSAQVAVYTISDYTDKDVREMFKRLNSGKPLNTFQKMTPIMSDELSDAIFDITSLPFFENRLTEAQLKSSVDQSVALEILMLCGTDPDHNFTSFRRDVKENFIAYYNDKVDPEEIDAIKEAIARLDGVISEDVKIPKTSVSVLCYASYSVIKEKKDYNKFTATVNDFLDDYKNNTEYKSNLSEGTNSADAVNFRCKYWENIVNKL